ncbi:MAG: RNA methyltransferase [Armatimonadetes bacterium]|nr:RNA methyltransferase [Armatimonadota bacterium]
MPDRRFVSRLRGEVVALATIESPHHPHIKALCTLARAAERQAQGRAVLPTARLIDAALRAGAPVEEILVHAAAADADDEALAARAVGSGARRIEVSGRVLRAIGDVASPPPLAAVVRLPSRRPLRERSWRRLVVCDGIADPGNLGTLIRTADAAGFDGVVLMADSVDPYNPKALRASAGSVLSLPILDGSEAEVLRVERVYVADASGAADYRDVDYAPPIALVFGSEAHGPKHAWSGASRIRVPVFGRAESLNVFAAAAVVLYEARRLDRPAGAP